MNQKEEIFNKIAPTHFKTNLTDITKDPEKYIIKSRINQNNFFNVLHQSIKPIFLFFYYTFYQKSITLRQD